MWIPCYTVAKQQTPKIDQNTFTITEKHAIINFNYEQKLIKTITSPHKFIFNYSLFEYLKTTTKKNTTHYKPDCATQRIVQIGSEIMYAATTTRHCHRKHNTESDSKYYIKNKNSKRI